MTDRTKIILLLDFYGKLLSDKQLNAMEAYYFNDFSLTEIADNQGVSKQAISDLIKRSEAKLLSLEEDLKLYKKTTSIKGRVGDLLSYIDDLDPSEGLEHISKELCEIVKEL